jgi:hypothetical protein
MGRGKMNEEKTVIKTIAFGSDSIQQTIEINKNDCFNQSLMSDTVDFCRKC